ncbi:PepSY domain-containing protein [Sphaerisporangium dianthi]|uniref:PepSY domain-containing protein n=1 Tax=Sphaerisporangium dianthi TaxID=1436120 RepID=A0ABV9C9C9_9ACTN
MTNAHRISKAAKLAIAGAGVAVVLGTGAAASAASPGFSVPSGAASLTGATGSAAASAATASQGSATSLGITYRQAIRIAKKRVPGARVTKVEREWEHGRRAWKVELHKRGIEYRVYISVTTGKIIKFRQKHDH